MHKLIVIVSVAIVGLSMLTGCSSKKTNGDLKLEPIKLSDINYELSRYGTEVNNGIWVNGINGTAGKDTFVSVESNIMKGEIVYYLIDWGDGTWSYNGPYKGSVKTTLKHVYKKSGDYKIKAMKINARSGKKSGFSKPFKVQINEGSYSSQYINTVKPISSSNYSDKYLDQNMLDNNNTTLWRSGKAKDINEEVWAGLRLDTFYRLSSLEVKTPINTKVFPQALAVEYTTDGGETWYSLPKYHYNYKYAKQQLASTMGLPNPSGATLVFELDNIVANGIRITSKLFPIDKVQEEKYLEISEIRLTGDRRPLFYSSKGGTFDADLNNMYTIYGSAISEPKVNGVFWGSNPNPYKTGSAVMTATEWLEWDGLQHIWTDYHDVLNTYTNALFNVQVGKDDWGNYGYVFATTTSPKHLGKQNHYTLNQTFIIAARNYLLQRNGNVKFLQKTDIRNMTIEKRLKDAMDYLLNILKGEEGIITILDPKNDGTANGDSSNYWDAYRAFGYQSCYENILFYASLEAMADIEKYKGNVKQEAKYRKLSTKAQKKIRDTFWDPEKGRFIMSIDKNGIRHDYGATFMNFIAIAYGIATDKQAEKIYEWMDGERIIESDTSKGSDIYGRFKYAARSNTLDVYSTGKPYLWEDWNGDLSCEPGKPGGYGNNVQNGGSIFYPQYYDIMGRIKSGDIDGAMNRWTEIFKEFHKDQLRRQGSATGAGFYEGVIGEFPESGLVPLAFMNGFIGITTEVEGIIVKPSLPKDIKYAGVREYWYNNKKYSIEVTRRLNKPSIEKDENIIYVQLPVKGSFVITSENEVIAK